MINGKKDKMFMGSETLVWTVLCMLTQGEKMFYKTKGEHNLNSDS